MTAILKVDTIQDTSGNNIINESSDTITIGASGDTTNIIGTLNKDGVAVANTPFFYGELASNQTLTRNSFVKITGLTNDELDSASAFDGTTFTVPSGQGGKYYLEGVVTGDYGDPGDGENTVALIYKNGSEIKSAKWQTHGGNQDENEITVVVSGLFNLSASDTIELYGYLSDASGDNAEVQADRTSFMGYKIIG